MQSWREVRSVYWVKTRTPPTVFSVPSTDNAFVSELWQDTAYFYKYELDHGAMILTAVSQGQSLAATQVDVSDFFYKIDTMVMDLPDFDTSQQIQRLVADAMKINLSIQSSHIAGLRQLLRSGKCRNFLGSMKRLQSLACSTSKLQNAPLAYQSISDIFGDNTWQHLHRLKLGRFHTSANKLAELLRHHRPTLQTLSLQHILFRGGSWHTTCLSNYKKSATDH